MYSTEKKIACTQAKKEDFLECMTAIDDQMIITDDLDDDHRLSHDTPQIFHILFVSFLPNLKLLVHVFNILMAIY